MKQHYFLNDFLDHDKRKTIKDRFLYLSLAFRPAGTLLTCIVLSLLIAIPCLLVMKGSEGTSTTYSVAFALFTGVVASGLVSVFIEMMHNYRHNYQRLLILHEYLLTVANYENHIQWCFHGRKDENCPGGFTARNMATAELVLEIGLVIEAAYEKGKEYMSLKEMKQAIRVIEAASRIGEIAESFASENMVDATGASMYDCLKEPFKTELKEFATDVGISIVETHTGNVVADYILTQPEVLEDLDQFDLRQELCHFDEGMCELVKYVGAEPGYNAELIPWEQRNAKRIRKIKRQGEKHEEETLRTLQKAVNEGRITQREFDEYLELISDATHSKEPNLKPLYDQYGYDNDEAFDKALEKMVKREEDLRHKKLMQAFQILAKAQGFQFDPKEYSAEPDVEEAE